MKKPFYTFTRERYDLPYSATSWCNALKQVSEKEKGERGKRKRGREEERQMSRQTWSKSSSDFAREKTDEGETREFTRMHVQSPFRVLSGLLICRHLATG